MDQIQCKIRFEHLYGNLTEYVEALVTCNTTAGQNILIETIPTFAGQDVTIVDTLPLQTLRSEGPNLDLTTLVGYWFASTRAVLESFAPPGDTSFFLPSVLYNNLTSLRLEYLGTPGSLMILTIGNSATLLKPNTPADDYWILYLSYSQNTSVAQNPTRIPIAFLPTGDIDMTHTLPSDLEKANNLIKPTIQILRDISGDNSFDIWRLFNWLFVGIYWSLLADLGQIAPTAYDITIPLDPQLVSFPPTNNIYVNQTLFEIFSDYFNSTIVPLFLKFGITPPPPILLDDNTRLKPIETTLLRSYSCAQRQPKSPISLIISVIAADYALIAGAYTITLYIAGQFQKKKDAGKL